MDGQEEKISTHSAFVIDEESRRLAALAEYQAVVTQEALDFGPIVDLAAQFFKVPIALVTFVEKDRQSFKAKVGLSLEGSSRYHSFCAHALQCDAFLIVPDARKDERFTNNPFVTGPAQVRFYAGAPLRTVGGFVLGTLCIIDHEPRRHFSAADRKNLQSFAQLVLDKLETHRLSIANRRSQSRFESIAQTSPDGIICANHAGKITFWNQASERLFGFDATSAMGSNIDIIIPAGARGGHGRGLLRVSGGGEPRLLGKTIELDAIRRDGSTFPVELSLSMWTEQGNACFGAIIRDITARRASSKKISDLAYIDGLTKVPNRHALMNRIDTLLEQGRPFALLMLDLDGFKEVNDTLGHHAGDEVLRQVAERLIHCVRSTDTFSRLGGDEFAVLIPLDENTDAVDKVGTAILRSLEIPFEVDRRPIHITGSVGAALFPHDGPNASDLLSAADMAMYRAKADGRNRLRFFTPNLRQALLEKHAAENALRNALEQQEFELFYQPQIRISDGAVLGAEALLRWRHPEEGILPPTRFLATIESGTQAASVGRWVIAAACTQAAEIRKLAPDLVMGVNLFAAHFQTGSLVKDIAEALRHSRLPAAALELEISENMMLSDDGLILNQLHELRKMGVGIAFDDFGTGYASLSLLKIFPLTRLKIDKSFIDGICTNPADAAIVDAVINIAETLQFDVIAEGVETVDQSDFLHRHGCNAAQGYLHGEPMSAPDFHRAVSAWID